ncbi:ABC transporter substrate-binding protein [Bradyrhizobium retamae]|uniref:Branched-chain amino acid ABC transporter substrate-binding protein n=1 Tax=Bradyrhizobium retamae TaxID=1300035 RepID=A0A0R3MGS4_9BRAD|nr:ABC transporter substrate-binding protein [Bradyrhizobium retamae]KRR19448.1 branched-chain amino acid ABC transporter substrate-binding protein [Bradyrhizobium retamae]
MSPNRPVVALAAIGLLAAAGATFAQGEAGQYDPGVTDTSIKIGNIMPYSGPASAYGVIGTAEAAYFREINDNGGVNGRKINFISYDDSYSPPKTVEQARKLVEDDEALLIFNSLGTPTNTAIQKYMNLKKVPQLFVATGATKWNDPKEFPWTMGWQPSYQTEAHIYAKYILQNKPDAKIAVLYQNDDYGKDYLKGLEDGLGAKANLIVAKQSYDVNEPTIDSEMVNLRASGANVFVDIATPKFAAQSITKANELNWHPLFILNNVSSSVGGVIKPAGFDKAQGIISAAYLKDPTDPQWKDDPEMKLWTAFMDKYLPNADKSDANNVYAYAVARTMVQVLRHCGDDLSRDNVMKHAANLRDYDPGLLLPGIKVNTSPTEFAPIQQLQLMRFKGQTWERFGTVQSGKIGS